MLWIWKFDPFGPMDVTPPQGSDEPDAIGSSGGGDDDDDDDNTKKKRIPKTTRILLDIQCWVILLIRANHRINIYIQAHISLNIYLYSEHEAKYMFQYCKV